MRWQMNKCYRRPCDPEKSEGPLDPLLPTAIPTQLNALPTLHPYMALLVSYIVNHRGLSRWRHLSLTTGLRTGYILFTDRPISLQKSGLQLRWEGTLNAGQAGTSLTGFSVTF